MKWFPIGRRRKGGPRNSLMQEVTTGMREKGSNGSTEKGGEEK